MFNAVDTNEDGAMLSRKSHILPSRKDERVILHFDCTYIDLHRTNNMQYAACLHFKDDCFYASVFEAENPDLKEKPLAVQQKQIIVHLQIHLERT